MTERAAHPEAHPDVAGYLLGTLSDDEAVGFERHLDGCAACRNELETLGDLPGLLAALPVEEVIAPELEEATFAAIEREAARDAAPRGEIADLARARNKRRWSGTQLALSSVAAAIVAVAGVGIGAKLTREQPSPVAIDRLVAPQAGPARGTATIRATLTGLTIDLDVRGLPPSPPGTIYTCWLVGKGDTLQHQNRVSVGSFVVGKSGSANVLWNTGANLKQFPQLGVTLEPDNGDPLHQGPKVLETI
jgi:hypothetical protein